MLDLLGSRGRAAIRNPTAPDDALVIGSDGAVDPAHLHGLDAIINCAGRVDGALSDIEQANVTYPIAVARAARAAGVPRFVQVSSFAVYGSVERIGPETPLYPASPYGRSKLEAERRLQDLATPDFRPLSLRLPFMFSAEDPALLGRLVAIMRRLGALPSPAGKLARRSMITYAGAAEALLRRATTDASPEVLAAADPRPLALTEIAQAVARELDRRITILNLPRPAVAAIGVVAPGVATRLFRSSVLDASANLLDATAPFPVAAELHRYLELLRQKR
jgi:UDP-glucose 4-epimerase